MEELSLQKVTIPGPTLASLMNRFSSSPADADGLLFGRVSEVVTHHFSDDIDSTSAASTSSTLVATVTAFITPGTTCSFYDSSGQLNTASLRRLVQHTSANHFLIGWFSARRRSPLRLSLREFSVSLSLTSKSQFSSPIDGCSSLKISPCIFLLLTTPFPDHQNPIHTFDFRAYQFRVSSQSFDAKPFDIINIGPDFRGHYSSFCPSSQFPYLSYDDGRGSPMKEDEKTLSEMKKQLEDQKVLDLYTEGYAVENLSRLMGSQTAAGLEEFYEKMLAKLDSLARSVESSSAKVLEQENRNTELRYKAIGLE
ncbi:hypothetical protein Dimus_030169 [Dionaea muscipula]